MTSLLKNNVAKGCAKRKYSSAVEARRVIIKLAKKTGAPFGSFYECNICGGFHITSRPPDGRFGRL